MGSRAVGRVGVALGLVGCCSRQAEAKRIRADAEVGALRRLAAAAEAYAEHPALLRLRELETLGALGSNAAARLYIGFEKHSDRLTAE